MTNRSSGGHRKDWRARRRAIRSGEVMWGSYEGGKWEVTEMTEYRSWNAGRSQWNRMRFLIGMSPIVGTYLQDRLLRPICKKGLVMPMGPGSLFWANWCRHSETGQVWNPGSKSKLAGALGLFSCFEPFFPPVFLQRSILL